MGQLDYARGLRIYIHYLPFYIQFFHYNHQDATIFYYLFLKGFTCFGRFPRPSSGAHNRTFSLRYCQPILLQAGVVGELYKPNAAVWYNKTCSQFHLTHDTSLQQYWLTIPVAECTVMCS